MNPESGNQPGRHQLRFTFPILTLCKGGAQRMLVEITNGLVQKGHTVNILMPKNGDLEFELMANLIRTRQDELTVEDFPSADVIVSNFFRRFQFPSLPV